MLSKIFSDRLGPFAIWSFWVSGLVLFGVLTTNAATITEFPIPTAYGSQPYAITAGPDGNLWFTEFNGWSSPASASNSMIGKITTAGAVIAAYVTGLGGAGDPYGITAGPDGNLWFTNGYFGWIESITTAGIITVFTDLPPSSAPLGITAGPDGNLWFTDPTDTDSSGSIGKITPAGIVTEFTVPTASSVPWSITAGPDGNLWFTEYSGNQIGKITTSGAITEFTVPTAGGEPMGITAGPDGNLWFTEYGGNKIGKITTAGAVTEFTVPTAGGEPMSITAGPDGNLWFTEYGGNKIGKITPAGVVTEFTVPTAGSEPVGITKGPDGNLWFTEYAGNKIGQVIVSTAQAVNISIAPGSLNFGNVNVGQSASQTITITNQSSSTGALTGSIGTLSAPFSIVSGGGAFNLSPGQSATVTVQFSPTAAGAASGSLSITHNATNQSSPVMVALNGTGMNAAVNISISVAPGSLNFGNVNVGQSASQTITITNQSSSTAALTGSIGTLSAPFSIVSGGGAFNLPPGQSATVTVQFSPTAAGTDSSVLPITHNATNQSSPVMVALNGTGMNANVPVISVTPMSYDYGSVKVNRRESASFTVSNSGESNLTITSTSMTGTDASMFRISGGGSKTIKPGKSLTIKVTFKPTSKGSMSAALEITSNDPVTPTCNILLTGTGQ